MQKNLIDPHFPQTHGQTSVGVSEFAAGDFDVGQHILFVMIRFAKGIQNQRHHTIPAFRTMLQTFTFQDDGVRSNYLDDVVQGIGDHRSDIFRGLAVPQRIAEQGTIREYNVPKMESGA